MAIVGAVIILFRSGARRGLSVMGVTALGWFLGTLTVVGAIAVGLTPNPLVGVAIGVGAATVVTTIAAIRQDGYRSRS